ncbi:MAG TPA: hypothetical protein VN625_05715 [Desulfuromonadaceae bacterium]|nr:hypothetical protein [Desulfuromonadaceae bacterium]
MIFLALLVPPIYFLVKKRWLAFVLSTAVLVASIFLIAMIWLAPVILLLWIATAAFAVWDLRKGIAHHSHHPRHS